VPNIELLGKFNYDSHCPLCRILFFFHVPKFRIFFKYWLPVLFWMIVIFAASSDAHSYEHSSRFIEPVLHWLFPQMPQAQIEEIHHFIRKCGHLTEYAVLALLLWRALRQSKNDRQVWSWRHARLVMLLVMLYASTDEFHQRFVPTRTSLVSDVFIDAAGGAIALLALWIFGRCRKQW
jgi:VanZ family protein